MSYNATASKRFYDRNPEQRLLEDARYRAKRLGVECTLTRADVQIPEHCPVLKIPIIVGTGSRSDHSPSIDRIDPEGGYTKENTRVISWRANRLKQDATIAELVALAMYVVRSSRGE